MNRSTLLKNKLRVTTIYSGEYYVTNRKEAITTVLGSCISVCLHDKINRVSGINHFMLPKNTLHSHLSSSDDLVENLATSSSLRYGVTSMEIVINKMISMGARKKNMIAKVFGGANVLPSSGDVITIGEQNIDFIFTFLNTEGIDIVTHDTGDNIGRRIIYFTKDNAVYVKKIPINKIDKSVFKNNVVHGGEIELFS